MTSPSRKSSSESPRKKKRPSEKSEETPPLEVLGSYGLDAALTEEDDPELWAAAIQAHWPAADDPALNVPGLNFGIYGSVTPLWRFERIATHSNETASPLQAVRIEWPPSPPANPFAAPGPPPRYPHLELQVSRPTQGADRATVLAGVTGGVLSGRGTARVWRRAIGGCAGGLSSWEETGEVVSRWVR